MTKRARQGMILDLIAEQEISTQTALSKALAEAGYDVAQTTVSRDLAELGVVKVRASSGALVYATPGTTDQDQLEALSVIFQRWVMSLEHSGNVVVVRTPNGFADPVSQAIDESKHPGVLGTIAGENTVLVISVEGTSGGDLRRELASLAGLDES